MPPKNIAGSTNLDGKAAAGDALDHALVRDTLAEKVKLLEQIEELRAQDEYINQDILVEDTN